MSDNQMDTLGRGGGSIDELGQSRDNSTDSIATGNKIWRSVGLFYTMNFKVAFPNEVFPHLSPSREEGSGAPGT